MKLNIKASEKQMIDTIIKNIYNEENLTYKKMCNNYDQNEIFYNEIIKHRDISELKEKDFKFINKCFDSYIEKYK